MHLTVEPIKVLTNIFLEFASKLVVLGQRIGVKSKYISYISKFVALKAIHLGTFPLVFFNRTICHIRSNFLES